MLKFKWDRAFPEHNWRILDDGGGVHMATLHECALIDEVERLREKLHELDTEIWEANQRD